MNRIVKIVNGKRYLVNVAGWNDDVGPGAPPGELWMKSTTTSDWYAVFVTGSNVFPTNLSMSVSQSVLPWFSSDIGYQLVACDNGKSYFVFLSGSLTSASITISQSAYGDDSLGKNPLVLRSITDGNFYGVSLTSGSTGVSYVVSKNIYASASWIRY